MPVFKSTATTQILVRKKKTVVKNKIDKTEAEKKEIYVSKIFNR